MEKNNSKRETGPVVKVEHLTKTYGSVKAVDDISFEVRQGEIFGMLGPNGAGIGENISKYKRQKSKTVANAKNP
jgi:ABC-type branched-subunit amino acid transport system ATPase component